MMSMNDDITKSREQIVSGVAHALASLYFAEVVEPSDQSAEALLQTQARMKALHEAILTARDLLSIIDKAAELAPEHDESGVVVLPDVLPDVN